MRSNCAFGEMQPANKAGRADAHQHAQHRIEQQDEDAGRMVRQGPTDGTWKAGRRPKKDPPDEGRRSGRQRHRQESAHAHFGHHQFDGEHDPADGRVEGGGDARARARRDQGDALPDLHPQRSRRWLEPSEAPIWMMGPSRPTAATASDGQRRGQRLDHRDHRAGCCRRYRRSRPSLRARHGRALRARMFVTRNTTPMPPITGTRMTRAPRATARCGHWRRRRSRNGREREDCGPRRSGRGRKSRQIR